jgi:hypothetical protein
MLPNERAKYPPRPMPRFEFKAEVARPTSGTSVLAALRNWVKVSRPGEFRPQPLAEPYVTVSRHTAPIALPVALP